MLTPDERVLVRDALFRVLNKQNDARLFLASVLFVTESNRVPGELGNLPGPADYADQTLTVCLRYASSGTPSLLETLLRYLADFQGEGALAPLADRVHTGIDPNPSPFNDLWLKTERPFFDRAGLRGPLETLVKETSRPILRITVPDGAFGRTYGRMFIEHVADQAPADTMPIGAAISRGNGPTYDVTDLALDLLALPGIVAPLPARAEGSSYPRAIVRFLLTQLMARPTRWILVLDGFGQPDIKQEVEDAVQMLAASIANDGYRGRVRLVLTDYPKKLESVSEIDILEEGLLPAAQIAAPHLEPAVAAIGRLRAAAGKPTLSDADIPAVVQKVVDDAPADGKQRLEAFNTALVRIWSFAGEPTP